MSTVMVKRVLKRQKLESRQLDKLAEIYNFLDENGDGFLTPNELSNSIRKYIHKNVEDDDDETKTMDVVDEIGKHFTLNPYLRLFGNVMERHLWTKNPQSHFWF